MYRRGRFSQAPGPPPPGFIRRGRSLIRLENQSALATSQASQPLTSSAALSNQFVRRGGSLVRVPSDVAPTPQVAVTSEPSTVVPAAPVQVDRKRPASSQPRTSYRYAQYKRGRGYRYPVRGRFAFRNIYRGRGRSWLGWAALRGLRGRGVSRGRGTKGRTVMTTAAKYGRGGRKLERSQGTGVMVAVKSGLYSFSSRSGGAFYGRRSVSQR